MHADGFGVPSGQDADDASRGGLLALTARLRTFALPQRYNRLMDLEQALADQAHRRRRAAPGFRMNSL